MSPKGGRDGKKAGNQVPEDIASLIEDYLQQSNSSSQNILSDQQESLIQPNLQIGQYLLINKIN